MIRCAIGLRTRGLHCSGANGQNMLILLCPPSQARQNQTATRKRAQTASARQEKALRAASGFHARRRLRRSFRRRRCGCCCCVAACSLRCTITLRFAELLDQSLRRLHQVLRSPTIHARQMHVLTGRQTRPSMSRDCGSVGPREDQIQQRHHQRFAHASEMRFEILHWRTYETILRHQIIVALPGEIG